MTTEIKVKKWTGPRIEQDGDGELVDSDWKRDLPFGHDLKIVLAVGDVIYWDDRPGWRGKVTWVYDDGRIDWLADSGEVDMHINPEMFTVRTLA